MIRRVRHPVYCYLSYWKDPLVFVGTIFLVQLFLSTNGIKSVLLWSFHEKSKQILYPGILFRITDGIINRINGTFGKHIADHIPYRQTKPIGGDDMRVHCQRKAVIQEFLNALEVFAATAKIIVPGSSLALLHVVGGFSLRHSKRE